MSSEMYDESIFLVETVPPPAGEIDIYSAPTRLHAPPAPVVAALLAARKASRSFSEAELLSALDDDALVRTAPIDPADLRELEELFPALFATGEVAFSEPPPRLHVAAPARSFATWMMVAGFAVVSAGAVAISFLV